MRRIAVCLAVLLGMAWIGPVLQAASVGFGVGYEISGLTLFSALTETPIGASLDIRAQVGFATSDIAGLMVVTIDLLAHQVVPPLDPYFGLGIGAALTPPPYSSGVVLEGVLGLRAEPFRVVHLFLQARYLLRRSGAGWNAGPVFEGGLLVRF